MKQSLLCMQLVRTRADANCNGSDTVHSSTGQFNAFFTANSIMNLDVSWDNMNLPQNEEQSNHDKDVDEENGVKKFRVKNYIPKRSAKKFLEPPYNIGIAIILILIIIIIILASIKNKSTAWNCPNAIATREVILDASGEIILSDKNRFFIYDLHKSSLKLLHEVKSPVQFFDIGLKKSLFWIEANSSNIMSLHQYENGTKDINIIFDEARVKPTSMALDSINNNLYVVDESISGIIVINTDTKYYALLWLGSWLDFINPRYIVLDADEGIMFIASTSLIKRANMDGSNMMNVVYNRAIGGLALDPKSEKLFWIHNDEVIESCDYSGMIEEQILIDSVLIVDLTVIDGYLYWLRKPSENHSASQLWSCKVQNGTCDDHTMLSNALNTSTLMKVTGRDRYYSKEKSSAANQQKCQHMSLTTPSGKMTCLCNMSSQLVFNKNCEPVTQFVLYTINNVTRSRTLDFSQRIMSEPFWPTPYRVGNLSFKTEIDFDYDFENDDFYFSDDKAIYKIKLRGKSPRQETVLASIDDLYIEDLAYDWLSGNMYYSKRSRKPNGKHSLAVFNVRKGPRFQKILKYFDYDINFGMEAAAYGLAVHPMRGRLFFTAGEDGRRYIYQTTMNGTEISKFTNVRYVHEYRLIAVDYDKDRVYWISSETSVTHAKFDGTDRKDIASTKVRNAKTISINRQMMYLSDLDSVWRVNKETGMDFNRVSPLGFGFMKVSGARIISQAQVPGNSCRNRNGGCEQFCFYGANATCDCADGSRVTPDGACK